MEMTESNLPNFSLIFNTINSQFVSLGIVYLNTIALGQDNTFEEFVQIGFKCRHSLVIHHFWTACKQIEPGPHVI